MPAVRGWSQREVGDGFADYTAQVAGLSRVLVFGSIALDSIWDLPHFPRDHEKVDASVVVKSVGGSGANTASWLTLFGNQVALAGAVGEDRDSQWILSQLRAQGIATGLVHRVPHHVANRAVCLIADESKRIVRQRNIDVSKVEWDLEAMESAISAVDHVHVSSIDSAASHFVCRAAKELGKTLSIEMNGHEMVDQRCYADLLFCNSVELASTFGVPVHRLTSKIVAELMPELAGWLVVTNGPDPVIMVSVSDRQEAPVARWRTVIDRTGAGDAFDAGFLSHWLATEGRQVRDCAISGATASTRCALTYGGQARQ